MQWYQHFIFICSSSWWQKRVACMRNFYAGFQLCMLSFYLRLWITTTVTKANTQIHIESLSHIEYIFYWFLSLTIIVLNVYNTLCLANHQFTFICCICCFTEISAYEWLTINRRTISKMFENICFLNKNYIFYDEFI